MPLCAADNGGDSGCTSCRSGRHAGASQTPGTFSCFCRGGRLTLPGWPTYPVVDRHLHELGNMHRLPASPVTYLAPTAEAVGDNDRVPCSFTDPREENPLAGGIRYLITLALFVAKASSHSAATCVGNVNLYAHSAQQRLLV